MNFDPDLTIFINTHVDYDFKVKNKKYYKVVCNTDSEITTDLDILRANDKNDKLKIYNILSDDFTHIYWLHNNVRVKSKYIGFCMYRKYFEWFDNIPADLNKLFKDHDIIHFCSVRDNGFRQYKRAHNEFDIISLLSCVHKLYPDYDETIKKFFNNSDLYFAQLMIIPSRDFDKLYNFVFNTIKYFCDINNFKSKDDIVKHIDEEFETSNKYTKNMQSRLIGYLCERLVCLFIMKNYKNPLKLKHVEFRRKIRH